MRLGFLRKIINLALKMPYFIGFFDWEPALSRSAFQKTL